MTNRQPLAGHPCLTPLAMTICPLVFACKLHVRHTVALDHVQELTNKHREACLCEDMENPSVIDAWVRAGEVSQQYAGVTPRTGVVCHSN